MVEQEKPLKNIDNFTLVNTVLDINSRGKIHKAISKANNNWYELLILPKEQFKGKVSLWEELQSDIRKLKLLNHPNILRFISLIETPNTYYLCSEITTQGTLYDYILKQKSLSENESFEIFVQIFDAYKEFLRRAAVHANLTTKSIYKHNRKFKISSLFLKKNQRDYADPHKLCFIPPEALSGDRIDENYDNWSLGVIFCEMLFGLPPFKGESIQELKKSHDSIFEILDQLAIQYELSNECFSFIKGFFEKKKKERYYWNDIAKHPFFEIHKERIEIYLLENVADHAHECKNKSIIEDLINDKLSIFRKDVIEIFEKIPNDFGYYCYIYKRIIQSISTLSKIERKSSLEEELGNIDIDEHVNKHSIPKSLSDLDHFMVRSTSLSPTKFSKKSPINVKPCPSKNFPHKGHAITLEVPSDDDEKNFELEGLKYPDEMDEPISAKLQVTSIDLQKINAQYKQSKKRKLSVILENSVEVSTMVSKEVDMFEEMMKEMIYYYMHEKEIVEFLLGVAKEIQQDVADLQASINSFMIAKLALLRLMFLIDNLKKEENIFKLLYWEQLLKSPVYPNICALIDENKTVYLNRLNDYYKKTMTIKDYQSLLQKENINSDLSVVESPEPFLKIFHELIMNSYDILSKKAKNIEFQNKTQSVKLFKMAFKLISIVKFSKTLGVNCWDVSDSFDLSLFKEKLMNMSGKEVENLSFKVKKEI